tara:strand:+ start:732 stop:1691 length:960 start_codon:yes stop_codon:yes gene_type:complete
MVKTFNLYSTMQRIRLVEEKIAAEYHKEEMRCPVHLSIGQEAVPAGISELLSKDDHVVSAHRSHAHYLAKGGDLNKMISELFGKVTGCAGGKGGSMHLIDPKVNVTAAVPIVGSSISIGTGVGFGIKKLGLDNVVVVYFGDGATEEGAFSESLDFAALFELPVLFVCENNLYSVYTNLSTRQAQDRNLQKISEGHAVYSLIGDGNDVMDVYATSRKALDYIKNEKRPALVEFKTYRWLEHCGPNCDDHLSYRKENELLNWKRKCPIDQIVKVLLNQGHSLDEIKDHERSLSQEIEEAFLYARESAFPDSKKLYSKIYAK